MSCGTPCSEGSNNLAEENTVNIAISGAPGSGKSSVCHQLAQLGWIEIDVGQTFRNLSTTRSYTGIIEAQTMPSVSKADRIVDSVTRKVPASPTTRFVIDARLGFAFGQPCLSCLIECDPAVAGQRVYEASRAYERYDSAEAATIALKARRDLEIARFQTTYGVSYADRDLFDLVVDTTSTTPTEAALKIIEATREMESDCSLGEIGPFRGEYLFLSNFYVVEGGIEYEGQDLYHDPR